MRTDAEDRFRSWTISPSRITAVPHRPIRWPPSMVRKPRRSWGRAAWTEARVASSSSCSSSLGSTGGPPKLCSPEENTTERGRPARSRSSSAQARSPGGRVRASRRSRWGSAPAAWSKAQVRFSVSMPVPSFAPILCLSPLD